MGGFLGIFPILRIIVYGIANLRRNLDKIYWKLAFRVWGEPWSYLQPTTDINGNLLRHHRKMDWRWWRAQVLLNLNLI